MTGAETLILLVQIWGGIGVVVSVTFLTFGLGQIDEDARGAITFRPLLVPGILVLWPLVVWRWWVLATGRDKWRLRHAPPRRSHHVVAIIMAVLIALSLLTSYSIRQTWPSDIAPVQLEEGASQ
ncbi:hypothetical protein [Roseovarius sp. 2305UL8-3]|uniref:hypothetical protein n=1 Tax=Roseovarius conchicola TaxID=3121636 RepID=UPI003526C80F